MFPIEDSLFDCRNFSAVRRFLIRRTSLLLYCVAVDIISQYKKDTRRIENPHGEVHSARSVRNFQISLYFDPSFAGNAWMTANPDNG
jgi:hypothetical protein